MAFKDFLINTHYIFSRSTNKWIKIYKLSSTSPLSLNDLGFSCQSHFVILDVFLFGGGLLDGKVRKTNLLSLLPRDLRTK